MQLRAAAAIACFASVGAALISQHMFGMEPCPWCVLQRALFVVAGLVCLIGLVSRNRRVQAVLNGFALAFSLCGIAAALWQHFQAAASASCRLTLAGKIISGIHLDDLLPSVFEARASCADAQVNLLWVPYDFWSLALFIILFSLFYKISTAKLTL